MVCGAFVIELPIGQHVDDRTLGNCSASLPLRPGGLRGPLRAASGSGRPCTMVNNGRKLVLPPLSVMACLAPRVVQAGVEIGGR